MLTAALSTLAKSGEVPQRTCCVDDLLPGMEHCSEISRSEVLKQATVRVNLKHLSHDESQLEKANCPVMSLP